jgi:hypothetical protein
MHRSTRYLAYCPCRWLHLYISYILLDCIIVAGILFYVFGIWGEGGIGEQA